MAIPLPSNRCDLHLKRFHLVDRRSNFFFQPFKGGGEWVSKRYPSTGLQTINTQTFADAFSHKRNSNKWAFARDYVSIVKHRLVELGVSDKNPTDLLAIWIFKDRDIGDVNSYDELIELFFKEFKIDQSERGVLFEEGSDNTDVPISSALSKEPLVMSDVAAAFGLPPDSDEQNARTLESFHLLNAGPAAEVEMRFGERLTLITGDNGLGKSFLLEFAWWASTGNWAERAVAPREVSGELEAVAQFRFRVGAGRLLETTSTFDWLAKKWQTIKGDRHVEALAIFSRADGSFVVSDPHRAKFMNQVDSTMSRLTSDEVRNGRPGTIEGLIRDWVRWQHRG